jgi:hypothetical protein
MRSLTSQPEIQAHDLLLDRAEGLQEVRQKIAIYGHLGAGYPSSAGFVMVAGIPSSGIRKVRLWRKAGCGGPRSRAGRGCRYARYGPWSRVPSRRARGIPARAHSNAPRKSDPRVIFWCAVLRDATSRAVGSDVKRDAPGCHLGWRAPFFTARGRLHMTRSFIKAHNRLYFASEPWAEVLQLFTPGELPSYSLGVPECSLTAPLPLLWDR